MKSRFEQLRELEADASPQVWKRIESRLPSRRRRRWLFWIFAVSVSLTAALLIDRNADKTALPTTVISEKQSVRPVDPAGSNSHSRKTSALPVTPGKIKPAGEAQSASAELNADKSTVKTTENVIQQRPASNAKLSWKNRYKSAPHVASIQSSKIESTHENTLQSGLVKSENDFADAVFLNPIMRELKFMNNEGVLAVNRSSDEKKRKLTRWSIYAGAGITFSDYRTFKDSLNEYTESAKGLRNKMWQGGIQFDISRTIRISAGVSRLVLSQERMGLNTIHLIGDPGNPNNTYTVITPLGTITGTATDFNTIFFTTGDSLLFPLGAAASPDIEKYVARRFTLKEEFKYITIPVKVSYKLNRKVATPFLGLTFTTRFLSDHSVWLNDQKLAYDYAQKPSGLTFSAGVCAGVDIHLLKNVDVFINGQFDKSLNPILKETNGWKPRVWSVGSGLVYRLSTF
jgi:hypothetical protein